MAVQKKCLTRIRMLYYIKSWNFWRKSSNYSKLIIPVSKYGRVLLLGNLLLHIYYLKMIPRINRVSIHFHKLSVHFDNSSSFFYYVFIHFNCLDVKKYWMRVTVLCHLQLKRRIFLWFLAYLHFPICQRKRPNFWCQVSAFLYPKLLPNCLFLWNYYFNNIIAK